MKKTSFQEQIAYKALSELGFIFKTAPNKRVDVYLGGYGRGKMGQKGKKKTQKMKDYCVFCYNNARAFLQEVKNFKLKKTNKQTNKQSNKQTVLTLLKHFSVVFYSYGFS